jgi:hypothetical protein
MTRLVVQLALAFEQGSQETKAQRSLADLLSSKSDPPCRSEEETQLTVPGKSYVFEHRIAVYRIGRSSTGSVYHRELARKRRTEPYGKDFL